MKLNNLYGGVPENVSQRMEQTVTGLPEEKVSERRVRLSRPLSVALSCVLAVVLMTGAAVFLTDRERIEKREQEFVDPYAEVLMESTTDNGITMTINKVASDYYMTYIFFTLKNENGVFEKRPEFDEIAEDTGAAYRVHETKYSSGGGKCFTALSTSDYDPENPSDTIHAVLRARLYVCDEVTLDFKGLKS